MGDFSFRNQWSPFKIDGKKMAPDGWICIFAICCNSMWPPIWIIQPNIVLHALCVALDHVCLCSAHSSADTPSLFFCMGWEDVVGGGGGGASWTRSLRTVRWHALHRRVPPTGSWTILLWLWVIPNLFFYFFFIPGSSNWTVFTAHHSLFFICLV